MRKMELIVPKLPFFKALLVDSLEEGAKIWPRTEEVLWAWNQTHLFDQEEVAVEVPENLERVLERIHKRTLGKFGLGKTLTYVSVAYIGYARVLATLQNSLRFYKVGGIEPQKDHLEVRILDPVFGERWIKLYLPASKEFTELPLDDVYGVVLPEEYKDGFRGV